jgi:hypothetical protein
VFTSSQKIGYLDLVGCHDIDGEALYNISAATTTLTILMTTSY